jgi:hypothetical protein
MRDATATCRLSGRFPLAISMLLLVASSARGSIEAPDRHAPSGFVPTAIAAEPAHDGAPSVLVQADVQEEIRFRERLNRAKAELEGRNQARREAGWTPKSWNEQQVTRLSRLRDIRIRKQERALTRAEFEKARGEVYMQIARDYLRYGYRRYAYRYRYAPNLYTGNVHRHFSPYGHWANDRLALKLAAHFANRAARSKGIAAAQEFHANTYYERLIRGSETRIASLQKQIGFAKLAGNVP